MQAEASRTGPARRLQTKMTPDDTRLIKGAVIRDDRLVGGGYALVGGGLEESPSIRFEIEVGSQVEVRFVFGFRGVGWHHQCWLRPGSGEIRLYAIRDGIRIYRNHARIAFGVGDQIGIDVDDRSVRLQLNGVDLFHALADDAGKGAWGFTGWRSADAGLPPVVASTGGDSPKPGWLVFGDGYSNPAWPLRHFVGWPELLFGGRHGYLNAAVPAGNSLRVTQVLEHFGGHRLEGTGVVFAVGADDFLEGVPMEESADRLANLGRFAIANGARSVAFATIPARLAGNERVREWNGMIRKVAEQGSFEVIDFFGAMIDRMDEGLIGGGDYPAERAQELMAREAAAVLELPHEDYPLQERLLGAPALTLKRRLLLKAYGKLKARLGADETV